MITAQKMTGEDKRNRSSSTVQCKGTLSRPWSNLHVALNPVDHCPELEEGIVVAGSELDQKWCQVVEQWQLPMPAPVSTYTLNRAMSATCPVSGLRCAAVDAAPVGKFHVLILLSSQIRAIPVPALHM